ncbi:hypothetical protein CEXT_40531 [Caerostris extrusa]|uniref:Uncharacterized protein n=1 Tax=Caerostris extrusa TaxID=172846 RepID=A0AAV4YAM1_CAEEX|nr:hypothetical protein CEXT_40531 [Caerostris extrusa]
MYIRLPPPSLRSTLIRWEDTRWCAEQWCKSSVIFKPRGRVGSLEMELSKNFGWTSTSSFCQLFGTGSPFSRRPLGSADSKLSYSFYSFVVVKRKIDMRNSMLSMY